MLAIGRALVLNPRLLLLDEPLEGLAPLIVEELLRVLTTLVRDEGMSAIIVEQNPARILAITDHAVVLERGTVVHARREPRAAGRHRRRSTATSPSVDTLTPTLSRERERE